MIAVIVPAHNEEEHIAQCVEALVLASRSGGLSGEEVVVVVVLDDCSDDTAAIAQRSGAVTLSIDARNVGAARARGAQWAMDIGARWLAFTDADSVVGPDWIAAQLELNSDAVCGTVVIQDWGTYGELMRRQHLATYTDADGHRHIHGANLGVSALAYRRAGGFQCLESGEDVALVEALQVTGTSIAWSALPRVVTSARRAFRAPGGFGETLRRVEAEMTGMAALAAS